MGSGSGAYSKGEKSGTDASVTWFVKNDNGETEQIPPIEVSPGPVDIMEDAVAILTEGAAPMTTGREGRKSVEILNGIYESSQSGTVVTFPMEKPFIPKDGYDR